MIADQIIMFIVMLCMSYAIGERLVPQIAIVLLAVIQILGVFTGEALQVTEAYYIFLFVVNIMYAIGKMLTKEDEKHGYLE